MKIKLKKEFHDELKRLGVVKAYQINVMLFNNLRGYALSNHLNGFETFKDLIYGSFPWNYTKELHGFWETVSDGRHVKKFKEYGS